MSGLLDGDSVGMQGLVTTKLIPLISCAEVLERQHLFGILDQGVRCTLVVAPAGYGKTTLLSDWLSRRTEPSAFVALDAHDNEPRRFWGHVVAAFQ